jgi:hypothetical protein
MLKTAVQAASNESCSVMDYSRRRLKHLLPRRNSTDFFVRAGVRVPAFIVDGIERG